MITEENLKAIAAITILIGLPLTLVIQLWNSLVIWLQARQLQTSKLKKEQMQQAKKNLMLSKFCLISSILLTTSLLTAFFIIIYKTW